MRVQQMIDKIKHSGYYAKWLELKELPFDLYQKRWKDKENVYKQGLYNSLLGRLERKCPSFEYTFNVNIGLYEFTCHAFVSLPRYYHSKQDIEAKINICCNDSLNNEIEYRFIDLSSKDSLKHEHLEQKVKEHLNKFFWSGGILAVEQYMRAKTKEQALYFVMQMIRCKAYLNEPSMSESSFYRWVKRNFNIDSNVSIESTVKVVNTIGKQVETKKIYAMEFPDMDYFDGDIDDLENEIYELNRHDRNTILI